MGRGDFPPPRSVEAIMDMYDEGDMNAGVVPEVDSSGRPLGENRSPGIHLSHALKRIRKARGLKVDGIEGEQNYLRMFMGFVLERALEIAYRALFQVVRPVVSGIEYEMDGVFITPDGYNTEDSLVEEYKLTWTSMGKFFLDPMKTHPDWMLQVMAYCRRFGVTEARMFICFINGDYTYKPGHGPQIRRIRLKFTPDEIEAGWQMVMREVADIRKEAAA